MALPAVIQALLQGREVRGPHLVEFCFLSGPRRLSNLSYTINAGGHDWFGLRKLGATIEGLDEPGALEYSELRFSISGVDPRFVELFTLASTESKEEYVGRHVRVYRQFMNDEWQKLDEPQSAAAGIMHNIGIDLRPVQDGGTWYTERVISILAHNMFEGRGRPPASFYTPQDQQLRSPGDRGCNNITSIIETNIPFPWP